MRPTCCSWVYGSLVPLDFTPIPLAQALDSFRHIPFLALGLESRADWVANGVLYAPLGFLASRLFGVSRAAGALLLSFLLACLFCVAVAVAVEFTQLYFPPRTVSQNDLIAEAIGSLLGAALAPWLAPWLDRLRAVWAVDGARLARYVLQGYVVAYLLFCFFPFDFLLSAEELRGKVAGDTWGWLVAFPEGRAWQRVLLQWLVEIVLTLPFGMLLARTTPRTSAGLLRAALWGTLLGLAIEGGQFLVSSAVSQGASVLSRSLGMAGGVWAAHELAASGVEAWRRRLGRAAPWLLLPYVLLLAAASGWWAHAWGGWPAAIAAWRELHFMPFYYHYWTTEAIALFSLGSVAVMYLPVGALVWSRYGTAAAAATLAGLAALVVETGKLFQLEAHPDPTNMLIAAVAAGGGGEADAAAGGAGAFDRLRPSGS